MEKEKKMRAKDPTSGEYAKGDNTSTMSTTADDSSTAQMITSQTMDREWNLKIIQTLTGRKAQTIRVT